MSEVVQYNSIGQTLYFVLTDDVTGARKTGVAHSIANTSYVRERGSRVAITEVSISPSAAWTSGGWAEVDAVNNPGLYRLDVPNLAFAYAQGVTKVVITVTAAGCNSESKEIELIAPITTSGSGGATISSGSGYTQYIFTDGTIRKDYA